MSVRWTLALLTAGLALSAFSLWQQRRPREIGELAFPATIGLGLGLILVILALAHLVTLESGVPLRGRMGV